MNGETNLTVLLKSMKPKHNKGDYVFSVINDTMKLQPADCILLFKEAEGTTAIIKKETADILNIDYTNVYARITLQVHSSLEAVGLTATFSTALSEANISCNVVAAFYHDHIFVPKNDIEKAMLVLNKFSIINI